MSTYPVWKTLMVALFIALPGSLLLLALFVAHRKFVQRKLVPVPRSIRGRDTERREERVVPSRDAAAPL